MSPEELNETWKNVKKIGSLNEILNIKTWVNKELMKISELPKEEYSYCENSAKREILKELKEFLDNEIERLKNE